MAQPEPKWRRLPDRRPEQIIRAALEVFSERGFRSATMEEVARAAGITKGTIYLYFSSKEDLFLAVVRAHLQQAFDLLPSITFQPGDDPEVVTRRVGKAFLDVLMTPDVAKVVSLVIAEVNHLPALEQLYKEEILPKANMQLASLIGLGAEMGLVRQVDPVIAARCLFGMFFVFVITQEIFGAKEVTPMETEAIVDTIVNIYFRGMLADGAMK